MKTRATLFAIFGALGTQSATALELKGIEIGASQTAVTAQLEGLRCPISNPPKPADECTYVRRDTYQENVTALNTLADELVETWQFQFIDGRLGSMRIIVPHESFATVVSALVRKFGRPTEHREERMQNRMGAQYSGQALTWRRADGTLAAREYATSLDRSVIAIWAPWYLEKKQGYSERQIERRAGDL